MKRHTQYSHILILSLLALLIVQAPAYSQDTQTKVTSITVGSDNSLNIRYQGKTPSTHTFFLKGKKAGESRFIIDIKRAKLPKSKVNNSSSLKARCSQFNKTTVRVVLEGKEQALVNPTVDKTNYQIIVTFASANKFVDNKLKTEKKQSPKSPPPSNKETSKKSQEKKDEPAPKTPSQKYIKVEEEKIIITSPEQAINYKMFRLNKPERLVIDLQNWKAHPSLMRLAKPDSPFIKNIRSGYPSRLKKKTVRVVLDLSSPNIKFEHALSSDKKQLTIKLSQEEQSSKDIAITAIKGEFKVVIDAGHGGYDAGAIYGGTEEKELTLAISGKVAQKLKAKNVQVIMTRKKDVFVSLDERVQITKKHKPDIFVSIHCNALNANRNIKGIETYHYTSQSKSLAYSLHKTLVSKTKAPDRRVRKARFVVIRETVVPSVLLEVGYMSNSQERKLLKTNDYQDKVAQAITDGILRYLSK